MDTAKPTVVYLGNLIEVARALAALGEVRFAAWFVESDDAGEAAAFRELAAASGCALVPVHDRLALGEALEKAGPVDFGVVANFGIILEPAHLAVARQGFVNAHLGLLPEYPGRHPIRKALSNNEPLTGVTLHRMTCQVDKGPVLDRRLVSLPEDAGGDVVLERLSALAARMIADHLRAETSKPRD